MKMPIYGLQRMFPKEVGIMFKTEMVKGINDDRKEVTRRIVNGPVNDDADMWHCYAVEKDPLLYITSDCDKTKIFPGTYAEFEFSGMGEHYANIKSRWEVGNLLYARETWARFAGKVPSDSTSVTYRYKADLPLNDNKYSTSWEGKESGVKAPWYAKWKPGIHMPKEAARIFMLVTGLECQRLDRITPEDAILEGIEGHYFENTGVSVYKNYLDDQMSFEDPVKSFRSLWTKIHGKPEPVYLKGEKKPFKYVVYPFDNEAAAPYLENQIWKGLPLHIVVNPWVWVIRFKTLSKAGRPTSSQLELFKNLWK